MQTNEVNFGIFIAIILPGFIGVLGLAEHSETVRSWLGSQANTASVGGFLFLTVAAVFVGMLASTIRWLIVDRIHLSTGLPNPNWKFSKLGERQEAFQTLINIHYRYYQFYGNSIVAVLLFVIARWLSNGFSSLEFFSGVLVCILFFAGSRDTLRKYYRRVDELLSA